MHKSRLGESALNLPEDEHYTYWSEDLYDSLTIFPASGYMAVYFDSEKGEIRTEPVDFFAVCRCTQKEYRRLKAPRASAEPAGDDLECQRLVPLRWWAGDLELAMEDDGYCGFGPVDADPRQITMYLRGKHRKAFKTARIVACGVDGEPLAEQPRSGRRRKRSFKPRSDS